MLKEKTDYQGEEIMKKMLFVVNPKAGKKVIKNRVYQIINIFI